MLQQQSFGRLLEPGLRKVFMETYKEIPEQYSKVFNVQNSTKAIETDLRMGGFGLWEKKDSAGMVQYQDPTDTVSLQYIHEEFASGYTVERKLVDDEQYNQISKMSKALGRAARATIETKAAQIFNTAIEGGTGVNTPVNGFDGKPLISASHVRLDGGTMSNILAAGDGAGAANGALSDRNLKAALIQTRRQVDDKGILIQVQPKLLVVPPSLEYTARTILESSGLAILGNGFASGSTPDSNNNKNVLQGRLQVVVMDYFTSNTNWFLIDPTVAELNFFWRKRLEFKQEDDFSTMQAKYRGYMRFSAGYSDYRGIFGSLGTGAA
jgi:phage major head subunit gpT-like protein